jgi:hypothetical protein
MEHKTEERKKVCPNCGLRQIARLDCASCGTPLIKVKYEKEPDEVNSSAQATLSTSQPPFEAAQDIEVKSLDRLIVAKSEAKLCLQVKPGCNIELKSGDVIGRSAIGAEFLKEYPKVSRFHAIVKYENGQWIIEDLKSSNGLYLDNERITRSVVKLGMEFILSSPKNRPFCELTVVAC